MGRSPSLHLRRRTSGWNRSPHCWNLFHRNSLPKSRLNSIDILFNSNKAIKYCLFNFPTLIDAQMVLIKDKNPHYNHVTDKNFGFTYFFLNRVRWGCQLSVVPVDGVDRVRVSRTSGHHLRRLAAHQGQVLPLVLEQEAEGRLQRSFVLTILLSLFRKIESKLARKKDNIEKLCILGLNFEVFV